MTMMMYASIFTGFNLVILIALLATYLQNYRQVRATFSQGLIIFSSVFVLQKLVSLYLFIFTMFDYTGSIGVSMLILEVMQTIAFSALLWITLR